MAFIETHKKYLTKAAIAWAACLVLFLLAYVVVLRPQNLKKKHFNGMLAEKKQSFEAAQTAAQESTQAQLREQIRQLQERLHDFVIDFEDSANLTFDIGQIATEKNVTSFSVKSKITKAATTASELKHISEDHIDISFIAGFHQFATFVNSLERHRPILFVNEFTITKSNKKDSLYEITLDVAALIKKQLNTETAEKPLTPPLSAQT